MSAVNAAFEFDHLMTAVGDAERAGADFERLGFTVTPLSVIASMGLANRLVLFRPATPGAANFLELMAVHDRGGANAAMRTLLDGPPGIRSLVLASADAGASRDRLRAAGSDPGEVHAVRRRWQLPDGEGLDVAFDVTLPVPGPFACNLCRYHTLQHYRRAEWLRHRNGARRVVAVHAASGDPAGAVAPFERIFGQAAVAGAGGSRSLRPAAVELDIHKPAALAGFFARPLPCAEGYAGYSIAVESLSRMRGHLEAAGIPAAFPAAGGVVAGPVHGCLIRFIEEPPGQAAL